VQFGCISWKSEFEKMSRLLKKNTIFLGETIEVDHDGFRKYSCNYLKVRLPGRAPTAVGAHPAVTKSSQ